MQSVHKGSRPVFSENDLAEHATKESGIWVSYKGGVYDVTNWVGKYSISQAAYSC